MKFLTNLVAVLMVCLLMTACFGAKIPDFDSIPDHAVNLKLPDQLSDHAVLQRGPATNVWGKAAPNAEVRVYLGGKTATCRADAQGNWLAKLDLSKVKEGPFKFYVISGDEKLTREDFLVGEVFLAGGQSNMEKIIGPVGTAQYGVYDYQRICRESVNYPRIRMCNIDHRMSPVKLENIGGKWVLPNEKNTISFSAPAWFFAVEFQKHLDVPVGIINNSHGGSKMQVWTSREALVAAGEDPNENFRGKVSTQLYNAELWPIRNATFKAVLWYQGEQNGWESEKFEKLYKVLIDDWRTLYQNKDLPFIFVQLPSFRMPTKEADEPASENYWARTREAQRMASMSIPKNYMIVTTDTGEIKDVHTRDKKPIGERLAWMTLNKLYGKDLPADYPVFRKAELRGSEVVVTFDKVGDGLVAKPVKTKIVYNGANPDLDYVRNSPDAELENFALQDENGKWFWADRASVTGKDQVSVSCKSVAKPVRIRYNLTSFALGNLYGKNGLPATQFEEPVK